jgi:hypothetical protein
MTTRPISTWPGDLTPESERRWSRFDSSVHETMETLNRELGMLDATDVIMEVAFTEADFRNDGRLRAQAKAAHPGVILSFGSKHGPLRYATDTFLKWQDNLRAIALGLESLRRVERYGITKRGEQYVGWKQLEGSVQSAQDARDLLIATVLEHTSIDRDISDERLVRLARKYSHTDAGGKRDDWDAVQHAAETLGVA